MTDNQIDKKTKDAAEIIAQDVANNVADAVTIAHQQGIGFS